MSNSAMLRLVILLVLVAAAGFAGWRLLGDGDGTDAPVVTPSNPTQKAPVTPTSPENLTSDVKSETVKPVSGAERVDVMSVEVAGSTDFNAGTGTLSGFVRNERGEAVKDVDVSLQIGPDNLATISLPTARTPTGRSMKTDGDGVFNFDRLPPAANYVVIATHADYAQTEVSGVIVRSNDVNRSPDIVLAKGSVVNGMVSDTNHAPIAGATVELWDSLANNMFAPDPKQPAKPWRTTTTDERGNYEFTNVHLKSFEITVKAQGFGSASRTQASFMSTQQSVRLDFTLSPATGISGAVTDLTGRPIQNATIDALQLGQTQDTGLSKGSAISDANGLFQINGIADGTYNVTARAVGFTQKTVTVVMADSRETRIALDPQGIIAGVVLDATSQRPVTRFSLRLVKQIGGESQPDRNVQSFESKDGSFNYVNVEPGTYRVQATAQGYAPNNSEPVVVSRGETTKGATVLMDQGGTLTGRVMSGGKAVAGVRVKLNMNKFVDIPLFAILGSLPGGKPPASPETKTGEDGTWKLAFLEPGQFQVEFTKAEFATARVDDVTVEDNKVIDVGVTNLSAGGSVTGVCLDATGRAFPDGAVNCSVANGSSRSVKSDIEGRFEFKSLTPGTYKLTLMPDKMDGAPINPFLSIVYAQKTETVVEVREGEVVKVTLRLPSMQK